MALKTVELMADYLAFRTVEKMAVKRVEKKVVCLVD